jgi:predicted metalloprotease
MVDFDDDARLDTSQVEDRRGARGRRGGGLGGLPMGRVGGGGLGLVVLLVAVLLGANVLGGGGGGLGDLAALQDRTAGTAAGTSAATLRECRTGADADAREDCRVLAFINSVQSYWSGEFRSRGLRYTPATTVFYSGTTDSPCGTASAAVGPFYCPADRRVYVDLGFFAQLQEDFGASGGPFAQGYVLAHEYGHHVQELTGVLDRVTRDRRTGPQSAAVRAELQADCYAGVWAGNATAGTDPLVRNLSAQDVAEALDAAAAVGDDRIQQATQGRVTPENWTHGSAERRQAWFTRGLQGRDPGVCDTFSGRA